MAFYTQIPQLGKAEVLTTYANNQKTIIKDVCGVFAKALNKRCKQDFQNIVVVDGGTGSGKSTFAIRLARAIDPNWKLSENYIYNVNDLKQKLENPRASPVSLFDEGSIILSSKNSLRGDDKEIIGLFDTMRTRHWTTIICCPSMFSLNKTLRTTHIDFRCLCPSESPIYGYQSRGFVHIHGHRRGDWNNNDFFPYLTTGVFDKLPRAIQTEYNEIKNLKQARLINDFIREG